jgi:hypothetical protein
VYPEGRGSSCSCIDEGMAEVGDRSGLGPW